jgi:hypothetical protein
MSQPHYELVCERGPDNGKRFPLVRAETVIGRDPGCDIPLADEFASRRHAKVVAEGAGHLLVNMSSVGSQVNGKAVSDKVALQPGDTVDLGPYSRLRYVKAEVAGAAPPAAAAPPGAKALPAKTPVPAASAAPVPAAPTAVAPPATKFAAAAPAPAPAATAVAPAAAAAPPATPRETAAAREAAGRRRNMLLGFALYGVFLVVLAVLLGSLRSRGGVPEPVRLDRQDIIAQLEGPDVEVPEPLNPEEARKWSADALTIFNTKVRRVEDLYRVYEKLRGVAKWQKLPRPSDPEEQRVLDDAVRQLADRLYPQYRRAYVLDRAGQTGEALRQYRTLRSMIPNHRMKLYQIAVDRERVLTGR